MDKQERTMTVTFHQLHDNHIVLCRMYDLKCQELIESRKIIQELGDKNTRSDAKCKLLQQKERECSKQLEELQVGICEKNLKINKLTQENQDFNIYIKLNKKRVREETEELQQEIDALKKKIIDIEKIVKVTQNVNESLSHEANELYGSLESSLNINQTLEKKLHDCKNKFSALEDEMKKKNKKLNQEIKETKSKLSNFEDKYYDQLSDAMRKISELGASVFTSKQKYQKYLTILQEKDVAYDKLRKEKYQSDISMQHLMLELQDIKHKIANSHPQWETSYASSCSRFPMSQVPYASSMSKSQAGLAGHNYQTPWMTDEIIANHLQPQPRDRCHQSGAYQNSIQGQHRNEHICDICGNIFPTIESLGYHRGRYHCKYPRM